VGRIAFLTDRSPAEALPAALALGHDLKSEPLAQDSLAQLSDLAPTFVMADGEDDPERAFRLLALLGRLGPPAPIIVVLRRDDLELLPWHEVADELLHPDSSVAEVRLRLGMLTRRTGGAGEASLRLGPLAINVDTYQVIVASRVLDLTYKEFELLRYLVQRPGRVFTRGALLQQVWGYNFYGGTRTVDVHVRRLRAKLGPEHEWLIETVRGVGYRAAQARPPEETVDAR
jgi:DNA-binding response OmpR family regulator